LLFIDPIFFAIFLPITLIGVWLLGRFRAHGGSVTFWLAVASLVFYAYWDARFLLLLMSSILFNFWVASAISGREKGSSSRKLVFAAAIAANLAALAIFKYANFAAAAYASLTATPAHHLSILLPLGISFFTFTQIAYLADVRAGHPPEKSFSKYLLFITYFPHLIAGPILHHKEMMGQFDLLQKSKLSSQRIAVGSSIFIIGLFKKIVIADTFAAIAEPVFSASNQSSVGMADGWVAAASYALQIYFDFSGYCDMAIGISTMLNIRLPFNFDSPYKATSIIEFWRRWHITLSRFLRDYLYIPMGGNRKGRARELINLLLTMLLGGLWHGAGWTFIIWGGLHGMFLVANHAWRKNAALYFPREGLSNLLYRFACLALTQVAVVVAWVFFRADSVQSAGRMLKAMFGSGTAASSSHSPGNLLLVLAGYALCLLAPNINDMFNRFRVGLITYEGPATWSAVDCRFRFSFRWALFIASGLLTALAVQVMREGLSPFLYFQF
jgi:alginate O-acetyltransferase complex protein AlgI